MPPIINGIDIEKYLYLTQEQAKVALAANKKLLLAHSYDELVSFGYNGLVRAAKSFDKSRTSIMTFHDYAGWIVAFDLRAGVRSAKEKRKRWRTNEEWKYRKETLHSKVEYDILERDRLELLEHAMSCLKDRRERKIFRRIFKDGLTHQATARQLKMSPQNLSRILLSQILPKVRLHLRTSEEKH